MAKFRILTKRFFLLSNFLVAGLFLAACTNSFLNPGTWWVISFLGLIFPVLLLFVLGFFFFWLFFHSRRWAILSFITLVAGWTNIHAFFAFHIFSGFADQKPPSSFRVLTWNVHRWDEFITKKPGASGHRIRMLEFLKKQNADVMCFQEFFEGLDLKQFSSTLPYIRDSLHYPFVAYLPDYYGWGRIYSGGVILFSRFPLKNITRFQYPGPEPDLAAESLLSADAEIQGKTVRFFTTHLQSVLFRGKDYHNLEIITKVEDSVVQASKSILKKLKFAYALRAVQADTVRSMMDKSPFPAVLCADFNDVPNSYTYFTIRGNRQDAFQEKGFGIGRTYSSLSPTLRIDYLVADRSLPVIQCHKITVPWSDHFPLVTDLSLPQ